MKTLEIRGQTVHLSRRPDAETVVLARLASREGGIWDGLWDALAETHTLVNIELGRPVGIEDDPAAALARLADILCDVTAEIDDRPFHLVGWTGGTQIALQAAVRRPEALASMSLITPFREAGEMRQIAVGLDLIETLLRAGDWELYTRYWFMAGLSDAWIQANYDALEQLVARRLQGDPFVSMDIDKAMRWMRALRRAWVDRDSLLRLRIPTLIAGAGRNRWHAGPTREMAETLHDAIPGSELAMFEACGPLLLLEAPEAVARRIAAFIADANDRRS